MKLFRRNDHNSDLRTITIPVSLDDLMQLETEAAQERMSLAEYVYVKLFARDLTPQIRQVFEGTQRINQKMAQLAETLGQMAALEDQKDKQEKPS